jgi:hypothetical protein
MGARTYIGWLVTRDALAGNKGLQNYGIHGATARALLLIVFYSAETHNFKFDEQLICTLLLIKAIKWKELSRIHIPHYSKRFHNSKASKKKSKAREKINLSAGQLF